MTRDDVIKEIASINEEFTITSLLNKLGGKQLSIEEKNLIIYTLYDLLYEGLVISVNVVDSYRYIKSEKIKQLIS